ncbi:small GTP-binding protein domain-containing protein [Lachnospiraceae bacterium A10]|nr:small GTP-binding protein domain-containing protein [Lachnospiraceae bacterium A10]
MKKIVAGILAHVDAGKTTLSESMLYLTGEIRSLGRVDHRDTFLDTDDIERERGITVLSKMASLTYKDLEITFVDTPGHVDFSAEMERTLPVLDYAILVISGLDGVQSHTRTLWKLLKRYDIPTFIFVNKMDITHMSKDEIQADIMDKLSDSCVDFSDVQDDEFVEHLAMCSDALLEEFDSIGCIQDETICTAIKNREVFPVMYGSALKMEGVEAFLDILEKYVDNPVFGDAFGGKVYKINRDKNHARQTFLKVTGGTLKAKDLVLPYGAYPDEAEKVNEIRIYKGDKYEPAQFVNAGELCAVTGLENTYPGQGLGAEEDSDVPSLEPVLSYQVLLSENQNPHLILEDLRELEDEDPMLHIEWNEKLQEIHVHLMGKVQIEVLKERMRTRFQEEVDFGTGNIMYKETIAEPTMGHGHYEPLKHFADVVLTMEPLPENSGIVVETECPVDNLNKNYQHQVMNQLMRREQAGVLTCSPLTDVKITLVDGKSHKKHTEGGDFRKATGIAVRDGLLRTDCVLLEPYYHVTLEIPQSSVGRAMMDIEKMHGTMASPEIHGEHCVLEGDVPVVCAMDYASEVAAYTGGVGEIRMELSGYKPCHNAEEVMENIGYDFREDIYHPYESIYVHRENPDAPIPGLSDSDEQRDVVSAQGNVKSSKIAKSKKNSYNGYSGLDDELEAIFTRTFGEIRRPLPASKTEVFADQSRVEEAREEYLKSHPGVAAKNERKKAVIRKKYVLVDGYNVIFAWENLKDLSRTNLESARTKLMDILCNYQGFTGVELILVFDAYKVKGNPGEVFDYQNIHVVYTKEAQTADAYIERTTHVIANSENADVTVVSSDGLVQMIVVGEGARRISSREFQGEVKRVNEEGLKGVK